jgi:serine/threonine protein kinase/Tfp pilus assembly protein PilF
MSPDPHRQNDGRDDDTTATAFGPGLSLGQYRLETVLGKGGMGTVWRALDTKLNRPVAVKLLSDSVADAADRRRFQREAQLASSLNHPHILTVHDGGEVDGQQFLVTEFVDGGTLRDWLGAEQRTWAQIVDLLIGVADGLAAAHGAGILHRDIKPANILVARNGYAKLADFGLAKLVEAPPQQSELENPTRTGVIQGTIAYMSPEQAVGKSLDARSDIFSFGTVLYEALTGERPFRAGSEIALMQAIVKDAPPPLSSQLPQPLRAIVEKALEKDPAERYQSMREMVVDLRKLTRQTKETAALIPARRSGAWIWAAAAAALVVIAAGVVLWRQRAAAGTDDIRSIAVLPMQNFSGDSSQEYFSDGVTEAIISNLAQVRTLEVISRTSVMRYKGSTKTLPEIGKELGADVVVEGSVQRSGGRVRITAQLIRTSTDKHIWAQNYDRDLSDELKLEAEVAREIATEIRAQVTPEQTAYLTNRPSVNPAAQEELLQGRYYFWRDDFAPARNHFERATQLQPDFADAYAGLAMVDAYLSNGIPTLAAKSAALAAARPIALKAVELAPNLSEAYTALGDLDWVKMDWVNAEKEYKQAFALNPNQLDVCGCYGHLLALLGRFREAEPIIKHGAATNPLSPQIEAIYGLLKQFQRQYPESISHFRRSMELNPNSPIAALGLAGTYSRSGQYPEALALLDRPGFRDRAAVASIYALQGRRDDATKLLRSILNERRYVYRLEIATLYFALGDKEHGFEWLTQAVDEQEFPVRYLRVDPIWDEVRSDPRFQRLVVRLNIPDVN